MAAKKKTRFAILGLLACKPMSGYDIKKVVDVGLSHFWNENYGQIYPTLDQLVREGLATKDPASQRGKRRRFVYTITCEGQKAFREWISAPTDMPIVRNELQLKFFLSSRLSKKKTLQLIQEHQRQQRELLDDYRRSEELLRTALRAETSTDELAEVLAIMGRTNDQRRRQVQTSYLTLRQGIRIAEARLAWCEEVMDSL